MSTLTTLQNLIDNAKQTPSGKVEWTDTSLKGLQEEVKHLFATNAVQTASSTTVLQTLSGADSLLAIVENDTTLSKNGIYFWSTSPVVVGYTYAALGGGYWNFVRNPTTSPVTKIVAGTNVTISPTGGTGDVTINSASTAINATNWSVPTRLNATTFINSNIYDDTNITKTSASGFKLDYANKLFKFGDYGLLNNKTVLNIDDNNIAINSTINGNGLGLNLDFANSTYQLGDYNGLTFGTNISIYNDTNYISIIANATNDARIEIDGVGQTTSITNDVTTIGGNTNRTYLIIDDSAKTITTEYANNPLGLSLNMANRRFTIGDTGSNNGAKLFIDDVATAISIISGTAHNTSIILDDASQKITITSTDLSINSTINNTPGRTYTQRSIPVVVNGTLYYLPLYQ